MGMDRCRIVVQRGFGARALGYDPTVTPAGPTSSMSGTARLLEGHCGSLLGGDRQTWKPAAFLYTIVHTCKHGQHRKLHQGSCCCSVAADQQVPSKLLKTEPCKRTARCSSSRVILTRIVGDGRARPLPR